MANAEPSPIDPAELRRRKRHCWSLARNVGFIGRVEYRHLYSQAGGAQYLRGMGNTGDKLTVFAEAFDRDADPDDFSLSAIIAHERGHQLLARHPKLSERLPGVSLAAEEVLASVIGARVLEEGTDRDALLAKATAELLSSGTPVENAVRLVSDLWELTGELL